MFCIFATPDLLGNQYKDSITISKTSIIEADVSAVGKLLSLVASIPIYLCGGFDSLLMSINNLTSKSKANHGFSNRKLKSAADMAISLGLETSILPQKKKKDQTNKELQKADVINSPKNSSSAVIGVDFTTSLNTAVDATGASTAATSTVKHLEKESEGVLMGVDENGQPVVMKTSTNYLPESHDASQSSLIGSYTVKGIKTDKSDGSDGKSGAVNTTSELTETTPRGKELNIATDESKTSSSDYDSGSSLFYMYELDEKFWWRWPDPNTDCR